MTDYVSLAGYTVVRVSEKAVCVRKSSLDVGRQGVWLPRTTVQGGDMIDVGDTDICVQVWKADEEGLDTD